MQPIRAIDRPKDIKVGSVYQLGEAFRTRLWSKCTKLTPLKVFIKLKSLRNGNATGKVLMSDYSKYKVNSTVTVPTTCLLLPIHNSRLIHRPSVWTRMATDKEKNAKSKWQKIFAMAEELTAAARSDEEVRMALRKAIQAREEPKEENHEQATQISNKATSMLKGLVDNTLLTLIGLFIANKVADTLQHRTHASVDDFDVPTLIAEAVASIETTHD